MISIAAKSSVRSCCCDNINGLILRADHLYGKFIGFTEKKETFLVICLNLFDYSEECG